MQSVNLQFLHKLALGKKNLLASSKHVNYLFMLERFGVGLIF